VISHEASSDAWIFGSDIVFEVGLFAFLVGTGGKKVFSVDPFGVGPVSASIGFFRVDEMGVKTVS
jgi:hypothetical protein